MHKPRVLPLLYHSLFALAVLPSCATEPSAAPSQDASDPSDDQTRATRTTFSFASFSVDGLDPRLGASVVESFILGGVDENLDVREDAFSLVLTDEESRLNAAVLPSLATGRYMACSFFDAGRRELVTLGGRDGDFADEKTAELFHVDSGARENLDVTSGVAEFPVGCQAFFSPATDKGYVFGGRSSRSGRFSDVTYRYDPTTRTFAALDIAGPPARYDARVHVLDDGDALLVGGMGADEVSFRFYADLWRFDAQTETWSEVPTTSTTAPEGRRWPWTSVSPDESILLLGFGTDSPSGQSVLGDLWKFTLASGEWEPLETNGEQPASRAFMARLPGPQGSAGVLAFGGDAELAVFDDAFVLLVPDDLVGRWH